jgi:hypothetical protein
MKSDPVAISNTGYASAGVFGPDAASKAVDEKQGVEPPPQIEAGITRSTQENESSSQPFEQAEWLPATSVNNKHSRLQERGSNPDPEPTLAESGAHTGSFPGQDGQSTVPPAHEVMLYGDHNRARRKLIDTFARLTAKREHVLPLRLQLHDLRASLKHKRTALNLQDAQLIQRMRVLFSKNMTPEMESLLDDFTAMQEARDQLPPEEDDYDKLEDQLIRQEWELQEAELRIYGGGASAQISALGDDELAILEETFKDTESMLSTRSGGPAENSQPFTKYLSRRGDANIVKERIDGLRAERAQLIEEEIMRARIGLTLDEPSRAFLATFDTNHQALQLELTRIEEDILRLKEALVDDDGILFSTDQFDGGPWEIVDGQISDIMQRLSLEGDSGFDFADADPSIKEPLLLPVLPVEERLKPVFLHSSAGVSKGLFSTANYINEWLLHRLQRSLQEVHRFMSVGDVQRLNLSPERIKDLVLEWWFKDQSVSAFASARKSAAQSANLSIQTTPGHIKVRETKSETDFRVLQETVLHARRDQSPLLHNSGTALPASVARIPSL